MYTHHSATIRCTAGHGTAGRQSAHPTQRTHVLQPGRHLTITPAHYSTALTERSFHAAGRPTACCLPPQALTPTPHPRPPPSAAEYRLIAKKGEGTFSEVLKAQCIKNGKYVAIKCMKNHFDSIDQVGRLEGLARCSRPIAFMHVAVKCMKNHFDSIDQVGGTQIEGQAAT